MSESQTQSTGDSYFGDRTPDSVLAWRHQCWQLGNRVSLEAVLIQAPWLADNADAFLDLLYGEVLLREDFGESPTEDEYLQRFPNLSEQIRRQFQVHRAFLQNAPREQETDTTNYRVTVVNGTEVKEPEAEPNEPETKSVSASDPFPKIAGFQILGIAGRGGNGVAYRAMDTSMKRIVAIKLLARDKSADSVHSQQLRREAEASAALVHPNIVRVFQVGKVFGSAFLVMEYVPGGSLADRLRKGPLPVAEAVELCCQVADAIHFAHSRNIVHRDLKPGNILIDADKRPRVCDFGLARKLDSAETLHQTGNITGTPAYMPPEQARGENVDARADVYALGAVFYEMLSGRPPFQAATPWQILHQVLTSDIIPLCQLNSGLPRDLETICARCLEKNAARRYASAGEVFDELERFRKGEPINARPIGRIPRLIKWIRRNPVTTAVVTTVVTTVAGSLIAIAIVARASEIRISTALEKTQESLGIAETQRDVALNAMSDLVHRVHDDLQKRQASIEARGQVLESAIAGLKKIMEVAGDREDTRMTLATAYTRYGYILSQQGKNEEAEKAHLDGIEMAEKLTSDHGRGICAQGYSNIALHYVRAANPQATEDWANKTLKLAETLLKKDAESVDLQNLVIQAKTQLASSAVSLKDAATAFKIRQEAQELCAKLWAEHPERTTVRDQLLSLDQLLIGDCLNLGYFQLADRYLRESRELLMPQNPDSTEDVQLLGIYSSMLKAEGVVRFARGEYEEGMARISIAIAAYEKLALKEPNRPGTRLRLGTMNEEMANCCLALNRLDDCERHVRTSIQEIRNGMELGGPTYSVQRYAIAKGQYMLGAVLLRKNQSAEAVKELRQAAAELEPILDLFNTRDFHSYLSTIAEVTAGALGIEPHSAAQTDVEAVRRSLDAWRALIDGNPKVFADQEEQIVTDQRAAVHPTIRDVLTSQLAAMYAQQYSLLLGAARSDQAQLEMAEKRCIEVLKEIQSGSGADPLLHMRLPEYSALRKNDRFMQEFPLK